MTRQMICGKPVLEGKKYVSICAMYEDTIDICTMLLRLYTYLDNGFVMCLLRSLA